jgi:hypothetical protein
MGSDIGPSIVNNDEVLDDNPEVRRSHHPDSSRKNLGHKRPKKKAQNETSDFCAFWASCGFFGFGSAGLGFQ